MLLESILQHYRHSNHVCYRQGRQSWGLGGRDPRFWAGVVVGSQVVVDGSWILLYLIMYRKYVWKWWLLKRNRIICPEVAVGPILTIFAWKIKKFLNCLKKIAIFRKFAWKIQNFLWNCLKKSKFFGNVPGKSKCFHPDPRPPRIKTRLTPPATEAVQNADQSVRPSVLVNKL